MTCPSFFIESFFERNNVFNYLLINNAWQQFSMPIYVYKMNDPADCVHHKPTLPCINHKCCLFLWFYFLLCHANSKLRFFFCSEYGENVVFRSLHWRDIIKVRYFSQSSSIVRLLFLMDLISPSASAWETSKMPQLCTPVSLYVLMTLTVYELTQYSKLFQLGKKDFLWE